MKMELFNIVCKNEDCGYEFISNCDEHIVCPSCGEESLNYLHQTISADIKDNDINYSMYVCDEETTLASILIASTNASGDYTIARYDDNRGFRLNLKDSEFIDKIIDKLNLNSMSELEKLIREKLGADIHSLLIYDPIFDFIERSSYSDEDGCLYEEGYVSSTIAKKAHDYIVEKLKLNI